MQLSNRTVHMQEAVKPISPCLFSKPALTLTSKSWESKKENGTHLSTLCGPSSAQKGASPTEDWVTLFLAIQTPAENILHSTPPPRPAPWSPPRTTHLHLQHLTP